MPRAFRVLERLTAGGVPFAQAYGIAKVVADARELNSIYSSGDACRILQSNGFSSTAAAVVADTLRYCFDSARVGDSFKRNSLKFQMVRAGGIAAGIAETILAMIEPCVVAAKGNEIRAPLEFPPGAGKVVMCDFTHLKKPEMQKVRRAIVIARVPSSNGRTTLVPVSKTPSIVASPYHHEFAPGSYLFFHHTDPVWALCDHIYTVALTRVWKVNIDQRPVFHSISAAELASIRTKAAEFIGSVG